ncbi:MAG: hypothetical protein AAF655_21910 [Bacteroidota bacterium]
MTLYELIIFVSSFSTIIPIVVGLINRKQLDKERWWLMGLLFFALIIQSYSYGLFLQKSNNLFLLHFYIPVEFIILLLIYSIWFDSKRTKTSFLIFGGLFLSLSVINSLFFQPLEGFNSYAATSAYIIFILLSIAYFIKLLRDLNVETEAVGISLEKNPRFWINTGILIYFSSSLLIYAVSNTLLKENPEMTQVFWGVHSLFNILHYILYAIGLWLPAHR